MKANTAQLLCADKAKFEGFVHHFLGILTLHHEHCEAGPGRIVSPLLRLFGHVGCIQGSGTVQSLIVDF